MEDSKIIKKKITYNNELLNSTIQRDNFTVEKKYDKLSRESIIEYRCNCGIQTSKMFRYIYEHGGIASNV